MSAALSWAIAAVAVSVWMALIHVVQRRTQNAGYVDAAWAFAIGAVVVWLALTGEAPWQRRALVAGICAAWSFRLALYLFIRIRKDPEEDGRYATLREAWGDRFQFKLFWFYQIQAAAVLLFAMAPWFALQASRPFGDLLDVFGFVVAVVGLGGAALSDWQLNRFRQQAAHRGRTCREGLWRYSRHPNYFFEWVHWWGYCLLAFGSPAWWLAPLTPLVLLYFLLFKTGIPATEAQALQSRGADYADYQRTTSAFVPWFPKPSLLHAAKPNAPAGVD